MRILCIIESLGSGGAERQLSGLAVMLKERRYDVEVWYYVDKDFYLHELVAKNVVARYLSEARPAEHRFFALRKHINEYNPDTIISYSASSSMITCLIKMLGGRFKLIVSERNTTQKIDMRERFKFFLYKWADCIVPNSFSQRAFISKNFPNLLQKTFVITNYVDINRFTTLNKEWTSNDVLKIVCVGRLMPQKNIPLFIDAVEEVIKKGYEIRIDWFGQTFDADYTEMLYKKIKEKALSDVFCFHKPSSNIQNEYHKADVFCLPSLYEGFPNVLCEAMSCGLPVLCSRVCDNPHIAKEGENGYLFDPRNVEDVADTIIRFIMLDADTRKEMGKKSREFAESLFSSEFFLEKYLNII